MDSAISKNILFWNETNSDYNYLDILKDNPKYEIDILRNINKKSITLDSQENLNDREDINLNDSFIDFVCDQQNYHKKEFDNKKITVSIQKPYIELITSKDKALKLFEHFNMNLDIGIILFNNNEQKINMSMYNILFDDTIKFKTKNRIVLTYYKLNSFVKNKRNEKHIYLHTTTFNFNYDFLKKSFDNTCNEFNINCNDIFNVFIIGKNHSININHIFSEINFIL